MDRAFRFRQHKARDHIHCTGRLHSAIRKSKNEGKLAEMAEANVSGNGIMPDGKNGQKEDGVNLG